MPLPQSRGPSPHADHWLEHLPRWIRESPAVAEPPRGAKIKRSTCLRVLEQMGHRGERDVAGNLIQIWGGEDLADAVGVHRRTLDRYLTYLESNGLAVVLARGGVIGGGDAGKGRSIANTWGLPGEPGGLDHLRVNRRGQTMKPTGDYDAHGRPIYAPDVTVPGANTMLWRSPEQPSPAEAGYLDAGQIGPARTTTTSKGGTGPSSGPVPYWPQASTPTGPRPHHQHHKNSAIDNGHGRSRGRRGGMRRRSGRGKAGRPSAIGHVHKRDLEHLGRLLSLYDDHLRRATERGESPIDRLTFVAGAKSVMRSYRHDNRCDPGRMFAENVRRRRWLFVTNGDEVAAQRELHQYDRRQAAAAAEPLDDERAPQPQPRRSEFPSGLPQQVTPDLVGRLIAQASRFAPNRKAAERGARTLARSLLKSAYDSAEFDAALEKHIRPEATNGEHTVAD